MRFMSSGPPAAQGRPGRRALAFRFPQRNVRRSGRPRQGVEGGGGQGQPLLFLFLCARPPERKVLSDERRRRLKPGTYERTFDGTGLASGVYLFRLQAGDFTQTKQLLLLK